MKNFISILLLLISPILLSGQSILSDPGIKSGETLTYHINIGEKTTKLKVTTDIKTIEGEKFYQMKSIDETEEVEFLFRKNDFLLTSIHVNQNLNNSQVERHVALKQDKKLNDNELGLLDFRGLMYVMRAIPFKNEKEILIHIYASDNNFPMRIEYIGEENLVVNGISTNCYKLKLDIDGFWGKLFPKMYYWYSVAQPHYLVRSEGSSGGPGTPKRVVELVKISN